MHRIRLFVFFFFTTVTAFAQTHSTEIGLQTDNDAYLMQGSDRYYTNGFFLFYRHALKVTDSTSLKNKILGLELGQKIFNAQFGLDQILGWQYQIKNNFQLNLSAEYNRLLARASVIDLSATTYANLGTGFTGAGAGPLLRLGNFNQLFNSESTQSASIVGKASPLHQHELFFYYKPLFNVVGYDATIQGGLFNGNATFPEIEMQIKPFVFSQEFGITYVTTRWILNTSAFTRTIETNLMIAPHQWASVRALYRFK